MTCAQLIDRDGSVWHHPGYLGGQEADQLFDTLLASANWRQYKVRLFGKSIPVPRLVVYYGDTAYGYSGLSHTPMPMPGKLRALCNQIASFCQCPFNSILANLYQSGRDSMGWHADNEPELGFEPVIASPFPGFRPAFSTKAQSGWNKDWR